MRVFLRSLTIGWVGIALSLVGGNSSAWSQPQAPSTTSTAIAGTNDPELALQNALELERQRKWTAAIELYEEALDRWPGRTDFRHRLRLCETHYRLGRRYQDRSFRDVLLRLTPTQIDLLYDELLERIESHYVEPVSLVPLLRRGLDNLEVALRDPNFLQTNVPGADPARVLWLRQSCQARRERITARNRSEARAFVSGICDLANQALGLNASPVTLEFVYGACDALDDYTSYLTPDKLDDLFAVIDGNFVGLGVELKVDEKGLRLVGVIPGGPAAEAGLKVGERITHVEGQPMAGLGLDEAAGRLQGAEGTSVALTILDANGNTRELRLVRRPVEVRSVAQARIVDPASAVGYIQLTGFQKTSSDELRTAIASLQRQGMRFLILDVRGNPGGLLDVAVDIADQFIDQGVIVSTRGRAANQNAVYRAHPGSPWRMPLAILVDRDSASASEILAGALKDNHRAIVLGERSYGKGSVQSIFPLRTAPAGLKLTTAKFYSPLNRSYSEQGVDPDVTIRLAARPSNANDLPLTDFGDPAHDPVLERAITYARKQLSVAR